MTAPTTLPSTADLVAISQIATHPEFIKLIQQLEAIPDAQRLAQAHALLTPQELASRGIPIPQGFRITLRWFEDPSSPNPDFETTTLAGNAVPLGGAISSPAGSTAAAASPGAAVTAMPTAKATVCGSVGFVACVSIGKEL